MEFPGTAIMAAVREMQLEPLMRRNIFELSGGEKQQIACGSTAQASALVGVLVGGVYAGELVVAVLAPSSPAMRALVWTAGGCLLACLVWSAVKLLVEH